MSFVERLVVGLVILGLVLGIILLWFVSSPSGPCEDLGDWAKPVCKSLTWVARERGSIFRSVCDAATQAAPPPLSSERAAVITRRHHGRLITALS
jgi:hypothetical protein